MKTKLLLVLLLFPLFSLKAQWIEQASNIGAGNSIFFVDAVSSDVCWALSGNYTGTPVQEFTRTIDGGSNWVSGQINGASNKISSSISALNADTAWVAMWDATGGQGQVMRTNNGGATWTWQSTALFNSAGSFPDVIHFWNANDGVCLGDPVGGNFEIYTTSNGGAAWSSVSSGNIPSPLFSETGWTNSFCTYGDSTIWCGSSSGRLLKSTDKGAHWIAISTPYTGTIYKLAFSDQNHGMIFTYSGGIYKTSNGGTNWTLLTSDYGYSGSFVPGTDSSFVLLYAPNSSPGSSFSPDGGTSRFPIDLLTHTDVDFANDSSGWAGSQEVGSPMYKWANPIALASTNNMTALSVDNMPVYDTLHAISPYATFSNWGLNTQTVDVTMTITGGYSSTKTISTINFKDTVQVNFDPWTPPADTGVYLVKVYTSLANDGNRNNDTVTKEVRIYRVFENYGWTLKPTATPWKSMGSAFYLNGYSSSSPGKFYTFGGTPDYYGKTSVRQFSTASGSWSTMNPMPVPNYNFSAQTIGTKIYCGGGFGVDGSVANGPIRIYDASAGSLGSWSTGSSMPIPVSDYACGTFHDSLIYYIGGINMSGDSNLVQIYHVNTNTWSMGSPKPGNGSYGIRGSISGNTIVVAGGYTLTDYTYTNAAYKGEINPIYPDSITWTQIANYPSGAIAFGAAGTVFMNLKPWVLFTGGNYAVGYDYPHVATSFAYDVSTDQWLVGPPMISAVSAVNDFVGLIYNDSLWMAVAGGGDGISLNGTFQWLNLGYSLWTGIQNPSPSSDNAFTIYPNPSSGRFSILTPIRHAHIDLFNSLGEKKYSGEMADSQSIDIPCNLSPGIYFVRISDGNQFYTKKLIVQ